MKKAIRIFRTVFCVMLVLSIVIMMTSCSRINDTKDYFNRIVNAVIAEINSIENEEDTQTKGSFGGNMPFGNGETPELPEGFGGNMPFGNSWMPF